MKDNQERIKELEFEYNGYEYRYSYDTIEYKTKFGSYNAVCEIPISYTKYSNNKEVIEFVCKIAISVYGQGVVQGKKDKERELRKVLGLDFLIGA